MSKVVIYGANGAEIGKMFQKCNGKNFKRLSKKTQINQWLTKKENGAAEWN